MRHWIFPLLLMALLTTRAQAVELPESLTNALPESAEEVVEDVDLSSPNGLADGLGRIWDRVQEQLETILRQRARGAASVLLVAVLCGVVECVSHGIDGKEPWLLPMAGALSVTVLTAGSLDTLIGLGSETIEQLNVFSKALLPTLAAATAASGAVSTAAFHQVTTVFFVDLLLSLIHGLLMPLVYLYIGILTAASCLAEPRLASLADGLKKLITWLLTSALLGFTVYLSLVRVIAGTADSASVKVAKTAISGVVPVVGSIIAEASETVLIGAGVLKNAIGILGTLAILAVCALPFLQLGLQYLLYKLTAFLAGLLGPPQLCKLIDGLGGAFGLVLGMTGSCALFLLISVLSSLAAVMP